MEQMRRYEGTVLLVSGWPGRW